MNLQMLNLPYSRYQQFRTGYSYKVAVALSLFLGWLGADRFYLGYPALGLLKFCTVGFCGIGSLVDFILISMQQHLCLCAVLLRGSRSMREANEYVVRWAPLPLPLPQLGTWPPEPPPELTLRPPESDGKIVGPADGSDYIVDYYGARLVRLSITNETYRRTQISL
ncbi:TM2 domain-containing protein 1 [Bagarius yarrelli]|uniref:TM2 domain-containing protein 1 n=1 Tax=Bagarius yarrelli TaxID=175774 RepID=A0A556TS67_BAGYA|nr:TM2 domain-containing protein 1 [Bagarius yarrelli]